MKSRRKPHPSFDEEKAKAIKRIEECQAFSLVTLTGPKAPEYHQSVRAIGMASSEIQMKSKETALIHAATQGKVMTMLLETYLPEKAPA